MRLGWCSSRVLARIIPRLCCNTQATIVFYQPKQSSQLHIPLFLDDKVQIISYYYMKFCEKCWSQKLVQSPDLIICKGCGHSKRVLNVVASHDIDGGLYGKRHQSFVTQKSSKHPGSENTAGESSSWKQHMMTYQKTMKFAMEQFIQHYKISSSESEVILENLKQLWVGYLKRWRELDLPVNSVFTNPVQERVQEEELGAIEEADMKEELDQVEGNGEKDREEVNTMSRRRRSTSVEMELESEEELIKEQYTEESGLLSTKHQLMKLIRGLTSSMTMNTHIYFKKLLRVQKMTGQLVQMTARTYVRRLHYLHSARKQSTKEMLSYLKFQRVNMSTAWLRDMVSHRNQTRSIEMSKESLIIYIFVFDMLQYKLSLKSTENNRTLKEQIAKYERTKKLDNDFVNVVLKRFKLKTSYDSLFVGQKKEESGMPPYLDFHLIYSFVQLALLRSKQVFYVTEIVEQVRLNIEFWLDTNYLKVNSTPSVEKVRRNSIELIHTLRIEVKQSNRGRWIDRIVQEMELSDYKNTFKVMAATLIVNPDWIVNQDIECLATVVMFCKLMTNMDQQQNIALIPWELILSKFSVVQNQTYSRLQRYHERINESTPEDFKRQLKLKVRTIIANITEGNGKRVDKRKFQRLSDLKFLDLKKFQELRRSDQILFAQQKSYQQYKEIFSKSLVNPIKYPEPITITAEIQQPKRQVHLKPYLLNQLRKDEESSFCEGDILLPSNHYQTITDYRSNYCPLMKNQFMELLGSVSSHRCSIDDLYKKVQELEKQLILFQTN